ncbi:hemerythrin domain-containing protein [Colwellia psychrerythraea]|uniref:Hemerythrin HHE cation binding domain protein n=1 Tax=Colwellia psychrerythraea TaxID=28229 RepID=A0A099KZ71_COLPS|nr:hemerythrin domain-containing protein [Colwellia psychrerythraea]KGJ94948.1 Hemerythrin HHE cation binding domain protein [Colwellia psychrerythraea]
MSSISEYMIAKHRKCDDFFTEAESAVAEGHWPLALLKWQDFARELTEHLAQEEEVLFPQFEQAMDMAGPTQVMRMEHQQMRALVQSLDNALAAKEKDEYLGLSETLMVMMQQHNMKEEMMLYPMMAQHLGDGEQIIEGFKASAVA